MPNYEKTIKVRPKSTFPCELFNGFKFHFIKDRELDLGEGIARELISKGLVEEVVVTPEYVNKAEGPSTNANTGNSPGSRTRNASRA